MKAKILLSALLSLNYYLLSSQVPQGFNYQAIARDDSGNPIINTALPVRITIQSDSLGGTTFWIEEHPSVITNSYGLLTLILGKGIKQTGSSVSTFNDIDWSVTPKFIKTEVDYSGWKTLGSSRLWAVPYALVAGDLIDTIKKLVVKGQTDVMDEALFEVKNKNGQTVFAVYNEGVRIYVDDGIAAKKAKGGFAIGGFDAIKAEGQNYFFIDPDSIRMYIDDNPLKKSKGGFAIGGFDQLKSGNKNFLNVATDASGIINPSQNRVMWYPIKNAFLAGRVRIGTPDSVGENSFATGYESKAKGMYSQAMGFKAIANGDYSTAIGKNAVADNINSFAFGDSAQAKNSESYAIGRGAVASGYRSFAFGSAGVDNDGIITDVTRASGDYSFAIGQGSISFGKGSISIGIADSSGGAYSTSIGVYASSRGTFSTALGLEATASAQGSTAIGTLALASGNGSVALGSNSKSKATGSVALGGALAEGYFSLASGDMAYTKGYSSTALGRASAIADFSFAEGFQAIAKGTWSTAMGNTTIARGNASTAFGYNTKSNSYASLVIGRYNDTTNLSSITWNDSDPIFICGNGTSLVGKNAFTVYKNGNAYLQGNVGIGTSTPDNKLVVYNGTTTGRYTTSGWTHVSDIRLKENISTISNILPNIMKLRSVRFNFINDENKTIQLGFIAQDVEKIFPEFVVSDRDGYKSIAYGQISAVLVEAIKEQQQQIELTKEENRQLKAELDELKSLVNSLIANQVGQGNE